MSREDTVLKLEACTYNELAKHTKVISSNEIYRPTWIYLNPNYVRDCCFIRAQEIGPNADNTRILPDTFKHESDCWIRVDNEYLKDRIGKCTIRLVFLDKFTNSDFDLYVSYHMQNENPDKPYVYMKDSKDVVEGSGCPCEDALEDPKYDYMRPTKIEQENWDVIKISVIIDEVDAPPEPEPEPIPDPNEPIEDKPTEDQPVEDEPGQGGTEENEPPHSPDDDDVSRDDDTTEDEGNEKEPPHSPDDVIIENGNEPSEDDTSSSTDNDNSDSGEDNTDEPTHSDDEDAVVDNNDEGSEDNTGVESPDHTDMEEDDKNEQTDQSDVDNRTHDNGTSDTNSGDQDQTETETSESGDNKTDDTEDSETSTESPQEPEEVVEDMKDTTDNEEYQQIFDGPEDGQAIDDSIGDNLDDIINEDDIIIDPEDGVAPPEDHETPEHSNADADDTIIEEEEDGTTVEGEDESTQDGTQEGTDPGSEGTPEDTQEPSEELPEDSKDESDSSEEGSNEEESGSQESSEEDSEEPKEDETEENQPIDPPLDTQPEDTEHEGEDNPPSKDDKDEEQQPSDDAPGEVDKPVDDETTDKDTDEPSGEDPDQPSEGDKPSEDNPEYPSDDEPDDTPGEGDEEPEESIADTFFPELVKYLEGQGFTPYLSEAIVQHKYEICRLRHTAEDFEFLKWESDRKIKLIIQLSFTGNIGPTIYIDDNKTTSLEEALSAVEEVIVSAPPAEDKDVIELTEIYSRRQLAAVINCTDEVKQIYASLFYKDDSEIEKEAGLQLDEIYMVHKSDAVNRYRVVSSTDFDDIYNKLINSSESAYAIVHDFALGFK